MSAGGRGEEALAWWRGETTADGPRQRFQHVREFIQNNFCDIREWAEQGRVTSKDLESWEMLAGWSDSEFDQWLIEQHPRGRQRQPAEWNNSALNHPQQPVVGVCWYEASAYCQWLNAQADAKYGLPSEAQWEAAARGNSAQHYAWGDVFDNAHCNTFESHIRTTTPVGILPQGTALYDMNGNTWDWTTTIYCSYPYNAVDGREDRHVPGEAWRVLRGGSWITVWDKVYSTRRLRDLSSDRGSLAGFRLCVPALVAV